MENENLDIFNLNLEDFQVAETGNKGAGLYKPDPKNGKDNIYRSVVRFLPRIANPKQSAIKKFTYWLEDSEGNGGYYDSPKSISWDEKFDLDVWYVDNQSILLDIKILYMTIIKVITRSGINQDKQATMEKFQGNNEEN